MSGENLGSDIADISVVINEVDLTASSSCVMLTEGLICQSPYFGNQQIRLGLSVTVLSTTTTSNKVYLSGH